MSAKLIVKDHGLSAVFARAREIRSSYVKVGVLSETDKGGMHVPGGELTVAEIAAVLEYGTEDGHIPARPFVRPTFDRELPKLAAMGRSLMGDVLLGKVPIKVALDKMGASLSSSVRAYVVAGVPPPNAPSTIVAKATRGRTARYFKRAAKTLGQGLARVGAMASVKPLIDTGRMLGAITWVAVVGGRD